MSNGKAPGISDREMELQQQIKELSTLYEVSKILTAALELDEALSADGQQLASASEHGPLRVWKPDGTPQAVFQGNAGHYCVAWSPDGQRFALGSWNGVGLRQADGTAGSALKGHTGNVNSVAWHPDGDRLASGSRDKTVRLWEADGRPGPVLEGRNSSPEEGVPRSPGDLPAASFGIEGRCGSGPI